MRKVLVLASLLVLFCAVVVAQDAPKVEVFGGYSYGLLDDGDGYHFNVNGWDASVTGYLHKKLGVTGDFGGLYGSPHDSTVHLYTFLFGPTVAFPSDKVTVFLHALLGGTHVTEESTAFAMAYGGGVDVNVNKKFALRVGQFDYLYTHIGGESEHHFRYAGGIVLKF